MSSFVQVVISQNELKLLVVWKNESPYAGINFMQNHPNPRDMTRREQKPSPATIIVYKTPPRDKTGSQKPHPRDIKLEIFTNISMNCDTIWNEKPCGLDK